MAIDPISVWSEMSLKTWPERYWMLDIDYEDSNVAAEAIMNSKARYTCLIRDQAGISIILDEEVFQSLNFKIKDRFGPFRIISTDGELPFDVIGFIGPVLKALNEEGIKAGPQCGAVFDHLFIYEKDIERAELILQEYIIWAKSQQPGC